jgi:hypothetical protein
MLMTKQNIADHVSQRGYEPIQIDSIPEGFCFKRPDLKIGEVVHTGEYVAFVPLADWENENVVHSPTIEGLIALYKQRIKIRDGK